MKISIVIPAHNEQGAIGETIDTIPLDTLRSMGYSVEVLVVDNNSTDKTKEEAQEHGAIVFNEPTKGYGKAYQTGLNKATGDIIVTTDADGTYPLTYIPELVRVLVTRHLDFLNTNRFILMEDGAMPLFNKVGNKILTIAMRLIYGISIKDSQSGMWIFKRDLLNKIQLRYSDWAFSQEIKIEACYYAKCRYGEMPVYYFKRLGKTKGGSWEVGLKDLFHLFSKRFKR